MDERHQMHKTNKNKNPVECPRGHGLMQNQRYVDPEDELGIISIIALRCVNCGEVLDPVILKNRSSSPEPITGRARITQKSAMAGSRMEWIS